MVTSTTIFGGKTCPTGCQLSIKNMNICWDRGLCTCYVFVCRKILCPHLLKLFSNWTLQEKRKGNLSFSVCFDDNSSFGLKDFLKSNEGFSNMAQKNVFSINTEVSNGLDISHQFENDGQNNKVNNGYWKCDDNINDYLKMKGKYNAVQNNFRVSSNLENKLESLSKQSQFTEILERLHKKTRSC